MAHHRTVCAFSMTHDARYDTLPNSIVMESSGSAAIGKEYAEGAIGLPLTFESKFSHFRKKYAISITVTGIQTPISCTTSKNRVNLVS